MVFWKNRLRIAISFIWENDVMCEDRERGFIVIQPWMIDLGLTGNELIIFAVINGFSMDGKSTFNGGLKYLCDLTGIGRRTAINCLNKLVDRGFVKKSTYFDAEKKITFSNYSVNKPQCKNCTSEKTALVQDFPVGSEKIARGVVKKLHIGSEKIAPIKEIESKYKSKYKVNNNPLTPLDEKTESKFDAREELINNGCSPDIVDDFLVLRKKKKAQITMTAINGLKREAKKAGLTLSDVLEICCTNGWQGFQAEWINRKPAQKQSLFERNMQAGEEAKRLIFGDNYADEGL